MRIVFMGTPDFAVPCLEGLLHAGHEIVGVVTQPDKPKGRSGSLAFPPVKESALAHDLPVFQPKKVREPEFVEVLKMLKPEVIVVVAFGQLLPQSILDLPRYGCINVHASLLPKYRGAAPIQWAVIEGEKKSGVTIMQMDAGLDTGDILLVKELELSEKETGGSLFDKLSVLGSMALNEAMQRLQEGTLYPTKQGESTTAYAAMLTKQQGEIDFFQSATEIERLIRGLNPWPSAYTFLAGKTLKLWSADVLSEPIGAETAENRNIRPGEIIRVLKDGFVIACGGPNEALLVTEVQLEGKKRMKSEDFLRGYEIKPGTMLGREG